LLKWLYEYWQKNGCKFDSALANIDIRTITRNNEIVKCFDCFFGREYNNIVGENILIYLNADYLAGIQELGLDNFDEPESLINFFSQLGIKHFPEIYSFTLYRR